MEDRPPSSQQFVALAGLRGVAALAVVQLHGARFLGGHELPAGYLAVDFFFLLSGWVLAHAYDRRLAEGSLSGLGFLRARLIRLYPVYLLALGLTLFGWSVAGISDIWAVVAALLFLPDFWSAHFDWAVRPAWSLLGEWLANLPFGLFHRRLVAPVLVAIVAVALAALVWSGVAHGALTIGNTRDTWLGVLPRTVFPFFLGVLLYRGRHWLTRRAPAWSTWPAFGLLIFALCIPKPAGLVWARDLAIVTLVLPAILLFAANARPGPVTARIATALGDMSYPLYLLHIAGFVAVSALLVRVTGAGLDPAPLSLALPAVAGIAVFAWMVDRVYDRPVRRWLSKSRTTSPSPPVSRSAARDEASAAATLHAE